MFSTAGYASAPAEEHELYVKKGHIVVFYPEFTNNSNEIGSEHDNSNPNSCEWIGRTAEVITS